jgi:hypothetical protein
MEPYPAIGIHANHMDMTKFCGDDSAGYLRIVGELLRYVESSKSIGGTTGSPRASGVSSGGVERDSGLSNRGISITGAISGRNVVTGTQTTGGTTNFTFNCTDQMRISTLCL